MTQSEPDGSSAQVFLDAWGIDDRELRRRTKLNIKTVRAVIAGGGKESSRRSVADHLDVELEELDRGCPRALETIREIQNFLRGRAGDESAFIIEGPVKATMPLRLEDFVRRVRIHCTAKLEALHRIERPVFEDKRSHLSWEQVFGVPDPSVATIEPQWHRDIHGPGLDGDKIRELATGDWRGPFPYELTDDLPDLLDAMVTIQERARNIQLQSLSALTSVFSYALFDGDGKVRAMVVTASGSNKADLRFFSDTPIVIQRDNEHLDYYGEKDRLPSCESACHWKLHELLHRSHGEAARWIIHVHNPYFCHFTEKGPHKFGGQVLPVVELREPSRETAEVLAAEMQEDGTFVGMQRHGQWFIGPQCEDARQKLLHFHLLAEQAFRKQMT